MNRLKKSELEKAQTKVRHLQGICYLLLILLVFGTGYHFYAKQIWEQKLQACEAPHRKVELIERNLRNAHFNAGMNAGKERGREECTRQIVDLKEVWQMSQKDD